MVGEFGIVGEQNRNSGGMVGASTLGARLEHDRKIGPRFGRLPNLGDSEMSI